MPRPSLGTGSRAAGAGVSSAGAGLAGRGRDEGGVSGGIGRGSRDPVARGDGALATSASVLIPAAEVRLTAGAARRDPASALGLSMARGAASSTPDAGAISLATGGDAAADRIAGFASPAECLLPPQPIERTIPRTASHAFSA